jgi:arylformamidase
MTDYLDISRPLRSGIACWPGSREFGIHVERAISDGSESNVSALEMDVHTGTHVDAPLHFLDGGASVGEVGLTPFVGPAYVLDIQDAERIDRRALTAADVPRSTTRLLLRTSNSTDDAFVEGPFREDFAALTLDAAEWAVERRFQLVGIDYLSIQRYGDPYDTHRVLLGAGVCILEGLDLRAAAEGAYMLVCLPLRLTEAEAAPARAILFPEDRL